MCRSGAYLAVHVLTRGKTEFRIIAYPHVVTMNYVMYRREGDGAFGDIRQLAGVSVGLEATGGTRTRLRRSVLERFLMRSVRSPLNIHSEMNRRGVGAMPRRGTKF